MEWTVHVEAAGDGQVEPELLDELVDALAGRHAAVSAARGRYGAQFDAIGQDAALVVQAAVKDWATAVRKVGLPAWPIVRVEAMTVAEQEAELETPNFPALVGLAEAARMLGVSKQRLAQLAARPDFPEPMVTLASGPVWLTSGIRGFERRWPRKPGRPAKRRPAERRHAPAPASRDRR
jgi:hypothetical protein